MTPLPGSRVVHPDWANRNRPVAEGAQTGWCSIRRPGGTKGPFDSDKGTFETVPYDPHHTGSCRVQRMSLTDQRALTAEQQVTSLGYRVTVEQDAATGSEDIAVDDLVTIDSLDDNGDPTLVGRTLTVTGVARGSLSLERVLFCLDDLG